MRNKLTKEAWTTLGMIAGGLGLLTVMIWYMSTPAFGGQQIRDWWVLLVIIDVFWVLVMGALVKATFKDRYGHWTITKAQAAAARDHISRLQRRLMDDKIRATALQLSTIRRSLDQLGEMETLALMSGQPVADVERVMGETGGDEPGASGQ